jgi:2-polyprenyl-6-methoxyphenol hydroxylase-like FAD-dependent oxidoreductase
MFMENAVRAGEAMDVIAAGGGPAGLMTAVLLDAAGVRAEACERGSEPARQSRGTAMHPRTLEVLTMIDAGDGRTNTGRRDAASPAWNWLPPTPSARTRMQRTASRSSRP